MANEVTLTDFKALLFTRTGDSASISTFGAVFSEPPRCCDVVVAAQAWVRDQPRDRLGVDINMDEADGIRHIQAFIDAFGSSYFMQGRAPGAVTVQGLGRWVFEPEADDSRT